MIAGRSGGWWRRLRRAGPICGLWAAALGAAGQISLSTAVNLSLQNSPKVKIAEADVAKAKAVFAQSRDVFVPAVAASGGVGKATGAPLEPPIVFSIAAQSLVFSSSQRDYIRAARAGMDSAQLALEVAQGDAAEDAITTYITLDNALQRQAVQRQALGFASRLAAIVQDRYEAGVDPHIELTRARRTETQIRLQEMLVEDEIAEQAEHLARIAGLSARGLTTVHDSIPQMQAPAPGAVEANADASHMQGISAAFSAARAKQFTAHGEARYLLRPQMGFSANYSRISTAFTTYTQYYPAFDKPGNSFNALGLGVQITLPILDMVHRAKAREAAADAARSLAEAQSQQAQFFESRDKLRRSAAELGARSQLAALDRDLAQDQLDAVLIRLRPTAGAAQGEQLSPKDEENARLQERQRTLEMLSADLQLEQTEVMLMRQEGSLSGWLEATIPGAIAAPAAATTARPTTPVAPTVGTEPNTTPAGTVPSSVPTTGTLPSSVPSGPVTPPSPANPPGAPETPPVPPSTAPKP